MIERLHSIASIQKVFAETQRSPVVALASDLKDYLCKHSSFTPASILFNEFLANRFLKLWGVVVPDVVFIDINPDHLKPEFHSAKLQPRNLHIPTIGFTYLYSAKEVDNLLLSAKLSQYDRRKFSNNEDLLKIALFDIWMCNEDRNHNNYNLLLIAQKSKYYFVPIDHEFIFNTNTLDRELQLLTEDETIIHTPLFSAIFPKQKDKNFVNRINDVAENIYLWRDICDENLDEILSDIPSEWAINSPEMKSLITEKLFSDDWASKVVTQFKSFIHTIL